MEVEVDVLGLFLLVAVVGGGVGYLWSRSKSKYYQAMMDQRQAIFQGIGNSGLTEAEKTELYADYALVGEEVHRQALVDGRDWRLLYSDRLRTTLPALFADASM